MKRFLWSLATVLGAAGLVWVFRYQPKPLAVGGKTVAVGSPGQTVTTLGRTATPTPAAGTPVTVPTVVGPGQVTHAPGPPPPTGATPTPARTPTPTPGRTPTPTPTPTPPPTPTPTPSGPYRNGTYTGPTVTNAYGPVQVQIVVSGGYITAVNLLQMPSGGFSDSVTAAAGPILRQETLSAQSASINNVSGATSDTQSFITSLSSALSQA